MHALDAVTVIDGNRVVIVEGHTISRAASDDVVDDVFSAFSANVGFHLFLIDLDGVTPGTDDCEISPLD